MKIIIISLALFFSASAIGQETREMEFVDVLVEPFVSIGPGGSYEAGAGSNNIDRGKFGMWGVGGKVALKVGPAFLGFNYIAGQPNSDSDVSVSSTDRLIYPGMDSSKLTSFGVTFGLKYKRLFLWYTITGDSMKTSLTNPEKYDHEYKGSGSRVTLSFNIYKSLNAGVFYHERTFDKYTSNLSSNPVTNGTLPQALKTKNYGLTVSVMFPISRISDIAKGFQTP